MTVGPRARGRRPKASKGGNRAWGNEGRAAGAMAIWEPRERFAIGIEAPRQVGRRWSGWWIGGGSRRAWWTVGRFETRAGYL